MKDGLKDTLTVQPIPNWAFFSSFHLILGIAVLDAWILKKMPVDFGQRGDFQSSLRVLGYLPNWMVLSAMIALISQGSAALRLKRTALAVFLTPLLSGVAAACLKPLIRRPDPVIGAEGDWGPVPWGSEWWDGTDLFFPSEHAAVAFGAALAIGRRYPNIMPLALLGAFGCAATRVYEAEEINHALDVSNKVILAQLIVLSGNTRRTVIQVADTEVLTPHCNHRRCSKTKALSTQNSGFHNIQSGFHTTVGLHANFPT